MTKILNNYSLKNKKKFFLVLGFVCIAFTFGCQTATQRLQKENPNSVFLQMESDQSNIQKTQRILRFMGDEDCRVQSFESGTTLICPADTRAFLEALKEEKILENPSANLYQSLSPESNKRILESEPPIATFEKGNIQESLDLLEKEDLSNKKEVSVVKDRIRLKISHRSHEIEIILKKMISSEKIDFGLERNFERVFSPYYLKESEVVKAVDEFIYAFSAPEESTCRVETKEPNSPAYVMEGFEEAVTGKLLCDPVNNKRVSLEVMGNNYLNVGDSLSNKETVAIRGSEEFSYSVNSLSQTKEENRVGYAIKPWYPSVAKALSSSGREFPFKLRLMENFYVFDTLPSSFSPEYDRYEREFGGGVSEIGSIQNGKISATLATNGKFTMGGMNSDGGYDLMYGHPNGRFADGIWSSFTSVKIGEDIYNLHNYSHEVVEMGDSRVETATFIEEKGIRIHTIWEKPSGVKDGLDLGYRIVNIGTSPQSVGLRIFMDTWAGYSDGVPFALPGNTEGKDRVITEEVSFNPHTSAIWETTDFHSEGQVFLQNQLAGGELTPPDEVQLLNWGSAFGTSWDYSVSESRSVTGDSAAALVWQPKSIPTNKDLVLRTRFLSIQRDKEYSFQPESEFSSSGLLVVNKDFGNCENLHLQFSQAEGAPLTREGKSESKFQLIPGQKSTLQIPLTLQGWGESRLTIRETCQGSSQNINLTVNLPKEDYSIQAPLAEKDKNIPVQFTSKKSGRKIEARLIDPITDAIITKTTLKEEKLGDLFYYKGNLQSSNEGSYVIEYVDMEEPEVQINSDKSAASQDGKSNSNSQPVPTPKKQVRPKEVDLPKGFARVTLKSGVSKEGKILTDSLEEIQIQPNGEDPSIYTKRELKSLRYGR